MAEPYFDTRLGESLVGEAAVMERLHESAPGDILSLSELLTMHDFPFDNTSFPKANVRSWQLEDYLAFGKWFLTLQDKTGNPIDMTETRLRRLYQLGLGPEQKYLTDRTEFNGINHFKQEIGAPVTHTQRKYHNWTVGQFVEYGTQLEQLCKGKPTAEDYDAYSRMGYGPSFEIIQARIGGISQIDESLGYPNVKLWKPSDYIQWGVRVMEANHGELHYVAQRILATQTRGPYANTIRKYCGNWDVFKQTVQSEYERQQAQESQLRVTKLQTYQQAIAMRQLPFSFRYLSDDELLAYGAKYTLTCSLLPDATEEEAYAISVTDMAAFNDILTSYNPNLTRYDIEVAAKELKVDRDIWPNPRYMHYLRVTPAAISEYLASHAKAQTERLRRRRAAA